MFAKVQHIDTLSTQFVFLHCCAHTHSAVQSHLCCVHGELLHSSTQKHICPHSVVFLHCLATQQIKPVLTSRPFCLAVLDSWNLVHDHVFSQLYQTI